MTQKISQFIQCINAQLISLTSRIIEASQSELQAYQQELIPQIHAMESCLVMAQKLQKDIDDKIRSGVDVIDHIAPSKPPTDVVFIPYAADTRGHSVNSDTLVISSDLDSRGTSSTIESLLSNKASKISQSYSQHTQNIPPVVIQSTSTPSSINSQPIQRSEDPLNKTSSTIQSGGSKGKIENIDLQPSFLDFNIVGSTSSSSRSAKTPQEILIPQTRLNESNQTDDSLVSPQSTPPIVQTGEIDLDELLQQPLKPVHAKLSVNLDIDKLPEIIPENPTPTNQGLSMLDELLSDFKSPSVSTKELIQFTSPPEDQKDKILNLFSSFESKNSSSSVSSSQQSQYSHNDFFQNF